MQEEKVLVKSRTDAKITWAQAIGAGIFTGLSLLVPSLAGFNVYALGRIFGNLGGKFEAKVNNAFLASRNSKMLGNKAQKIEKQDIPQKSKTIDPSNLPNAPIVSTTPTATDALATRTPIEADFFGAKGALSEGIVMIDLAGKLSPSATRDKYAALKKEQQIAESQRIKAHLEKVKELDGEVSEVLTDVKEDFTPIERSRMDEVIKSLKDKKYQDYDILVESGPYGAVYYEVLDIVMEKSRNGIELTQIEKDILDAAVFTMGGLSIREGSWIKGESISRMYPFFKNFINDIKNKLITLGVIRNTIDFSELNKILFDDSSSLSIEKYMQEFVDSQRFNIEQTPLDGERVLDVWYIRIENAIKSSTSITEVEKNSLIRDIENKFDGYYKLSGWDVKNPYYRKYRLTILRIGEVLKDHGLIQSNSFRQIDELFKIETIRLSKLSSLSSDPQYVPPTIHIKSLQEKILTTISRDYFSKYYDIKPLIEAVMSEFVETTRDHYNFLDLLSEYRNSYRKRLLIGLVMKNPILTKVTSKEELSQLIFGDRTEIYSFLLDDGKSNPDGKPHLPKIWRIILTANQWSTQSFKDLFININHQELDSLKKGVKDVVDTWVFNARDYSFISSKAYSRFSTKTFRQQYELVQSVWLVGATLKSSPTLQLKLNKQNKILGIRWDLNQWIGNTKIQGISKKTLKTLLFNIRELIKIQLEPTISTNLLFGEAESTLTSEEKLEIYSLVISNVINYMKVRGMSLRSSKPSKFFEYYWNEEYTKAYHVIMGLGKHLGFDPLLFTEIKDISFKEGISRILKFARHHFRNEPELRLSLFIFDQVLTDNRGHGTWGTLSETEALIVQRNYEHLISLSEDISRAVIEREFNNRQFLSDPLNQWFYDNVVVGRWYANPVFESDILPKFNDRKDYMKSHTVLEFMQHNDQFQIAYERFYTNVIKDYGFELYGLLEMLHSVSKKNHIDATLFNLMVLTIDFGDLYNELLWDEGY